MLEKAGAVLPERRSPFKENQTEIPPSKPPEFSSGADSPLISNPHIPKTSSEFRKALGLPESQIFGEETFKAKKAMVEEYAIGQTSSIPPNQFAYGEQDLNYENEEIKNQLDDNSFSTRLSRFYFKKRLNWAGVKNADELIQALESTTLISNRKDFEVSCLVPLLKTLDRENESEAIKKLNLAMSRAREFYLIPRSYHFRATHSKDLIEFISVLANTSEQTFQGIMDQFKGKTQVLYNYAAGFISSGDSKENPILQILKQKGLTPEQQKALNQSVVWKHFADKLPFSTEPTQESGFAFWFSGSSDLLNPEITQQINRYYPYLIDWATGRLPQIIDGTLERDYNRCSGGDFILGLQHLYTTGKLAYLAELVKEGWNCSSIYDATRGLPFNKNKDYGPLEDALSKASKFQSEPEKVVWAKAFGEFFYKDNSLFTSRIDFYEAMIKSRATVTAAALILKPVAHLLPDFKPIEVLTFENGEVTIDRNKLFEIFRTLKEQGDLEESKLHYVNGLVNGLLILLTNLPEDKPGNRVKNLLEEELSVYSYIAIHHERIAKNLFDVAGGLRPNAAVINELATQDLLINSGLMGRMISWCPDKNLIYPYIKMNYLDELNSLNRVEVLTTLPPEYLATLPKEIQASIAFLKGLPETLKLLVADKGKEGIFKCIQNGQPTMALFEIALNKNNFNEIREFLTEELLSALPTEQRQFLTGCLKLPPEMSSVMAGETVNWPSYFTNGLPTEAFLRMVAIKWNGAHIDKFLAVADLSHLPQEEQEFWNYYKSIPGKGAMRGFLLGTMSNFSRYVVNGQPTIDFLEAFAEKKHHNSLFGITELLAFIKTAELPEEQRRFWEFYPDINHDYCFKIAPYLLEHRKEFNQLIEDGRPSLYFLNQAATVDTADLNGKFMLVNQILSLVDWAKMPPEEKAFWQYYHEKRDDPPFSAFLIANKSQFSRMVVDEKETPFFYQLLVTQQPQTMLEIPHYIKGLTAKQYQDLWRLAVGKEAIDNFLSALPKATDEARNAFTNNDYDRTTHFIKYLRDRVSPDEFDLDATNFSIMADYIRQFGLAKNETIYRYYRYLSLFEKKQIPDLPEEMKTLGITTTAELVDKIAEVRKMVFNEKQLTDPSELRSLTPFQIQLLANVTRFDSARFGRGYRSDLEDTIRDFAEDLEAGAITPLSPEYSADSIEASAVKVEFNAEAVKKDYEVLKQEIIDSIDNPPSVEQLVSIVRAVIERRISIINSTLGRMTNEKAISAMTKDLNEYNSYLSRLDGTRDLDSLTLSLLGMNFNNADRSGEGGFAGIDSVFRRLVLSKLYKRHVSSPGFLENVRIKLAKEEVTADGIDEIILTIDEMIKNHVLNLEQKNKEGFWKQEVFETIIGNELTRRGFRRLIERFNPYAEKLRQEQAQFKRVKTGNVSNIKIIPDRGLIGELSGYLADVCYVRVDNLLKTYSGTSPDYPLVVPYKFVVDNPDSEVPRFVGSVLIFEVQTAKGEPALLVRALDIPDEDEIDVATFIENLLDKFAQIAAKRGKRKVLVAGMRGTISNYPTTEGHIISKYVSGKTPETLSPDFDFNNYDITNEIYTARTI